MNRPSRNTLIRYFKGECLPYEVELVEIYLAMNTDNEFVEACLGKAWADMHELNSQEKISADLNDFKHRFHHRKNSLEQLPPIKKRFGFLHAVAATFILLGATALILRITEMGTNGKSNDQGQSSVAYTTYREIKTGMRQVKQLILTDSTIVHMSANSVIRVPEIQNGKERQIYLDEGEAYFEVARDTLRPFRVQTTNGLQIEVLGTAFDIQSYGALDEITVAVNRGRVRVSDKKRIIDELSASEGIEYRKSNSSVQKITVDPKTINNWIKGVFRLEEADFTKLALTVHNLYGVELKASEPIAERAYRFNINLRADRTLEKTMEMICSIHKTTYRRNGNVITIYP